MNLTLVRRSFRRHRLYAAAYVGTLAIAVAAATVGLAVLRRAFLDPLPYPDGGRLVSLLTSSEGQLTAVSPHVLAELERDSPPLVDLISIRPEGGTYTGDGSTEQLLGAKVAGPFFSALGVAPIRGRAFQDGDRDVVVVSYAFWQRALGGRAEAVGQSMTVDGLGRTIIGVMPPGFMTPYFAAADIWQPLDLQQLIAGNPRARRNITALARVAPGATLEQVDGYLATFSRRQQQNHPDIHGRQSWVAQPLRTELVGAAASSLIGVGAAAALLVLIVIANIAGLSAVRALALRHQVAIRAALGAGRSQLLREQLAESLLLAGIGGVIGVWLGRALLGLVRSFQTEFLFRMAPVSFDWTTAAAGIGVAAVCGLIAALVGASAGAGGRFNGMLRSARGATDGAGHGALRSGLVISQVALALVLVAGAGLLVRTMANLAATPLGFTSERVYTTLVNMPGQGYAARDRQLVFEDEVVAGLERIPGVVAATASVGFPIWGGTGAGLSIQSRPTDEGRPEIAYLSLSPNFLGALGVPVLEGRGLEATDGPDGPGVVVINETMARMYWPAGGAVGSQVRIGPVDAGPWITVVGIIADLRQHGPVEPIRPTAFGSTRQYSWPRRHFAVRTQGEIPALAAEIVRAIRTVDPGIAVGPVRSVDAMVADQTARHRLVMITLGFFGAVATLLSGLGLYAVVALASQLRRREYAVRLALGARLAGVRWMVVRQALLLAAGGVMVGLAMAAGGTRALAGLLHGVTPMDTATLLTATIVVLMLAIVAAWLPARAAGRVDPADVLKAE